MSDDAMQYPWYPWYIDAYRASRRVQKLDITQRGIYRELLDECWKKGYIPDDLVKLAEICSCPVATIESNWSAVRPLFDVLPNSDSQLLCSARLEVEKKKRDDLHAKKSAAGRVGGLRSHGKTRASKQSLSKTQQSQAITVHNITKQNSTTGVYPRETFYDPAAAPPAPRGAARLVELQGESWRDELITRDAARGRRGPS